MPAASCQERPSVAGSCRELPGVAVSCQELPGEVVSCRLFLAVRCHLPHRGFRVRGSYNYARPHLDGILATFRSIRLPPLRYWTKPWIWVRRAKAIFRPLAQNSGHLSQEHFQDYQGHSKRSQLRSASSGEVFREKIICKLICKVLCVICRAEIWSLHCGVCVGAWSAVLCVDRSPCPLFLSPYPCQHM